MLRQVFPQSIRSTLIRALSGAADFVLPPTCAACDVPLLGGSLELTTPALCPTCFDNLTFHQGPQCGQCATQVDALFVRSDLRCGACLRHPPAYGRARAPLVYEGTARTLILRLKHGGRRPCAALLARFMAPLLPTSDDLVIAPVPLHLSRLRKRGFNQSLLIAQHLARVRQIPLLPSALVRTKATPSQGGLSGRARYRNVAGAFAVPDKAALKGKTLILIDDVMTTGATAHRAAQAAQKSGVAQVQILAAARALPK